MDRDTRAYAVVNGRALLQVWYAVPPGIHRARFEKLAQELFPKDAASCSNFLRHKTVLITPALLRHHAMPVVTVGCPSLLFLLFIPIGLWAALITTSLEGHHALPHVTLLCHGVMAQETSSDEDSPKTNSMNSKQSKLCHPGFLLLVSRPCSSSLLCTNIVPC